MKFSKAIENYYAALFRLKNNTGNIIPPGSRITLDNVSKEAGNGPSAIRKSRPEHQQLILDIESAEKDRIAKLAISKPTSSEIRKVWHEKLKNLKIENDHLKKSLQDADNKLYAVVRENFILRLRVRELENSLNHENLINFKKY